MCRYLRARVDGEDGLEVATEMWADVDTALPSSFSRKTFTYYVGLAPAHTSRKES